MTGVVHVICATLRPEAEATEVANALRLGHGLGAAVGVRRTIVGRSDRALAAATWLPDRDALEPFAASEEHMSFIMRGLAPCISSMWSAAVETDALPPSEPPAALWTFALADAPTLYEWQVRDALAAFEQLPGTAAAGITIEERERYRGGGVVCLTAGEIEAFREALERAQAGWGDITSSLAQELVSVEQGEVEGS